MKKRTILILFIIIISFIIFNYKVFLGNYYFLQANNNYLANNFSGALDGYNNSLNYINGEKIDFNKGNTYYKIGEKEKDIDKKIAYYTGSLNLYNKILENDISNKKQENQDVRYNYEFVKKKLEELQKQEEEQQEENEKQQEQDNEKKEQDKKDESDQNNQGETDQNELGLEDEMSKIELSPEELNQIKDYIENLKQEEKYNREYLNNIKPIQTNPFFDNIFDRGGEKDW